MDWQTILDNWALVKSSADTLDPMLRDYVAAHSGDGITISQEQATTFNNEQIALKDKLDALVAVLVAANQA